MIADNQKEFYEIEKSEDGTKVTFRLAGKPDRNFVLAGRYCPPNQSATEARALPLTRARIFGRNLAGT